MPASFQEFAALLSDWDLQNAQFHASLRFFGSKALLAAAVMKVWSHGLISAELLFQTVKVSVLFKFGWRHSWVGQLVAFGFIVIGIFRFSRE